MKISTRIIAITGVVVLFVIGLSLLVTYSDFRYLLDGERGLERPEMEELWRFRLPLTFGIGALVAATLIGLLRAARARQKDEWLKVLSTGTVGLMSLMLFFSWVANSGDYSITTKRLRRPPLPYEVIPKSRWLALAEQSWRGLRPMGPLLEYSPGLRDFTGYLPFLPCLLEKNDFVGLTREQVIRVLGPPIPSIYWDRQYLQYRMKESEPRGRIANLVFALQRSTRRSEVVFAEQMIEKRGLVVTEQHLYPERLTVECR